MTEFDLKLRDSLDRLIVGKGARANIGGILEMLGCAYFTESMATRFIPRESEIPTSEPVIRDALLCLLTEVEVNTQMEDVATLLLALHIGERWKHCLAEPVMARKLTYAALVQLPDARRTPPAGDIHRMFHSVGVALMNEWLDPANPFGVDTSTATYCQSLFGEPWWEFIGSNAGPGQYAVALEVLLQKAEFVPGVLQPQGAMSLEPLPTLE